MKVGAITLMTAFLLALPLAAFAGTDPCAGIGDADSDGFCDDVDNCINTAQADQSDVDSDGQGDVCDNCLNVANGPTAGPYPGRTGFGFPPAGQGALTPGLQCDTNQDGFGNACDPDMDNNNFALASDFSLSFQPATLAGPFVFVANSPALGKTHPDSQEADQNCDNFVLANDFSLWFQPGIVLGPVMAGRSGIATGAPGCCPPHN